MAAPPDLQQTIERLSMTLEKSERPRRQSSRGERRNRRERMPDAALENASVLGGVFALVMALVMAGVAVTNQQFWWLIFVALGIGSGGAKQLAIARKRDRLLGQGALAKEPEASQQHEVDVLCNQLLLDLKASPEVVRAFLKQPEQTVEALRMAAKAVDQHRKDLAASEMKEQLAALERQRQVLKARRDASSDVEARAKLDGALRSLDGQESALKLLVVVSDRLDGEYTSLLGLLQELKARVAVARSTNAGSQLDGLEQNVKRLNDELEAITESLVMTPVDEGVGNGASLSPERERVGRTADS